jgi:hypothetical protein
LAQKLNISGRCVLNWFYWKIIPAAVHQGKVIRFREGDVMAALERARIERDNAASDVIPEGIVRLALWLAAPDVSEKPAWLLTCEPTQEEEETASKFALAYFEGMQDLETQEERRVFAQGVIHANFLLNEPD